MHAHLHALREPGLTEVSFTGPEQDVRLLVDYRDDLVDERKRVQLRRWHCHDLEIALVIPRCRRAPVGASRFSR